MSGFGDLSGFGGGGDVRFRGGGVGGGVGVAGGLNSSGVGMSGWASPTMATPGVGGGGMSSFSTSPAPGFASAPATGRGLVPPSATYSGAAAQPQGAAGPGGTGVVSAAGPAAAGLQLQRPAGRTWQRPTDTRDPLFAAQFHGYVRVRGLVRAALTWLLLVAPLLLAASAILNVLGGQPWYKHTLRMAVDPQLWLLVTLQLVAAIGHAYVLDVPTPDRSSSPVSTPFAQAALMLSLSSILSTLAFGCVAACSSALLFWWKAYQLLPTVTDASVHPSVAVSEHEAALITAWWFRCFYVGGGAVGLAHGLMLRWSRKHVLRFPPHQRRTVPRLRAALPSTAVGAAACVLRAGALVALLLVAWAVLVHGWAVTRSYWWTDRFTTTILALGLTPPSVRCVYCDSLGGVIPILTLWLWCCAGCAGWACRIRRL